MTELWQALAQGVLIGSTYGLLALGMGLVYGVSGVVNFSHGDFISLGMFMCLALFSAFSLDPYVSAIITIPVMTAVGAVVYRFLIRPMVGHQFLMIVQLTLGLSLALQNGILMVFGGQPARTPSVVESKLIILGEIVLRVPHVIAFAVSFGLAIASYYLIEQPFLRLDVVVERAPPEAHRVAQLGAAGLGVAVLGEESRGDVDDLGRSLVAPLLAGELDCHESPVPGARDRRGPP